MTAGLPLSDIVNVQVTLDPTTAATRNFGALLILGDSGKIPDANGAVLFTDLASVGDTFATTDPEYIAATLFFAQSPQPSTLYIANFTKNGDGDQTATLASRINDLASASGDWYGLALAMKTPPKTLVSCRLLR